MPPWGVPVSELLTVPSPDMMPAFRNALISARTRLSTMRVRTRSMIAEWASSSNERSTHYLRR